MNNEFKLYTVEEIKESNYKNYPNYRIPTIIRYLQKHVYCVGIIWSIILINIVIFIRPIISFFKILFVTDKGFQWVSITAIVGLGTFIYNIYSTHKNNYYNTVSKARIEWIKEHRNNIAKLILDCDKCLFKLKELVYLKENGKEKEISFKEDELSKLNQEIQLIINKLLLQLSSNDDNSQFVNCIEDCGRWVSSIVTIWNNIKDKSRFDNILYDTTVQKNIMLVSQDYYKREWEKAKAGK
ncbi:hypothetical protein [Ligilactobacillus salivarius]|uniref:hypothetical protein n=1 Tax=Ligilactobacillus salivarius TaxID=1624 RepID=UPI002B4A5A2E|nr:hypothetical protein [Ligilactobacillus salivarius]